VATTQFRGNIFPCATVVLHPLSASVSSASYTPTAAAAPSVRGSTLCHLFTRHRFPVSNSFVISATPIHSHVQHQQKHCTKSHATLFQKNKSLLCGALELYSRSRVWLRKGFARKHLSFGHEGRRSSGLVLFPWPPRERDTRRWCCCCTPAAAAPPDTHKVHFDDGIAWPIGSVFVAKERMRHEYLDAAARASPGSTS
jgi:hypothetical protein